MKLFFFVFCTQSSTCVLCLLILYRGLKASHHALVKRQCTGCYITDKYNEGCAVWLKKTFAVVFFLTDIAIEM